MYLKRRRGVSEKGEKRIKIQDIRKDKIGKGEFTGRPPCQPCGECTLSVLATLIAVANVRTHDLHELVVGDETLLLSGAQLILEVVDHLFELRVRHGLSIQGSELTSNLVTGTTSTLASR